MTDKKKDAGMSLIVRTTSRLTSVFLLVFGVFIFTHGHMMPGGGFAGGLILALSFVNLMLAYGKDVALAHLPKSVTAFFENLGALVLLSIALLGFTGGYFFLNFLGKGRPFQLFSAGIIPLANLAVAVEVGTGIFAVISMLVLLKLEENGKDRK